MNSKNSFVPDGATGADWLGASGGSETVHPLHLWKLFVHFLELIDSVFQVVSEFTQFLHCAYVLHVNAILKEWNV